MLSNFRKRQITAIGFIISSMLVISHNPASAQEVEGNEGVSSVKDYDENRTKIITSFKPVDKSILTQEVTVVSHGDGDDTPHISLGGEEDENDGKETRSDKGRGSIELVGEDGEIIVLPPHVTLDSIEQSLNARGQESQNQVDGASSSPISMPRASLSSLNIGYNSSIAEKAVEYAKTQLGVPYVWGGTSPNVGLDCSGFTQYAYSMAGVSIPRVTYDQVNIGTEVSINDIKPGDLVFPADVEHVQMYIGNNQVIHAPQTGDVVKIAPLGSMPVNKVVRVAS